LIRGVVNARHEAVVRLRVRGPVGLWLDVDAIVDTGFTASLTLPDATADMLGLARQSGGVASMADGTVWNFDIYAAEVRWEGGWRPVLVSAIGNEVLIGLQLLAGSELKVAVVPGGEVEITPLP
jgi:predicted aspartyl protease